MTNGRNIPILSRDGESRREKETEDHDPLPELSSVFALPESNVRNYGWANKSSEIKLLSNEFMVNVRRTLYRDGTFAKRVEK